MIKLIIQNGWHQFKDFSTTAMVILTPEPGYKLYVASAFTLRSIVLDLATLKEVGESVSAEV